MSPYISHDSRDPIDEGLYQSLKGIGTPGELNYAISKLVSLYLKKIGGTDGPRYKDYNEAIGVIESAKLEIYRRLVSPYEDKKKEAEGDVF
jgi:hypothetical protein